MRYAILAFSKGDEISATSKGWKLCQRTRTVAENFLHLDGQKGFVLFSLVLFVLRFYIYIASSPLIRTNPVGSYSARPYASASGIGKEESL